MDKRINKTVSGFVGKHRDLMFETFSFPNEEISFEYKVESCILSKTIDDTVDRDTYTSTDTSTYVFDLPNDFVDILLAEDILEFLEFFALNSVHSLSCKITTTIHLPEHLGQDIVFSTLMCLENEELVELMKQLMEHKFCKLSFETVFCLDSEFSSNVLSDRLTIIPVS